MLKNQKGFTLIELVMIIVILGILAVVAIPRYVDLRTEANAAALSGVQGTMASSMAVNYAGCSALNHVVTANKCVAVDNCDDTGSLIAGGLPTGYTVAAAAIAAPNGTTATCTVTQTSSSNTATYTGIRAGM
jgi:MSHA pilin protein MshA